MYFMRLRSQPMVNQSASFSGSTFLMTPVASTWPCTMCPPILPLAARDLSKLIVEPSLRSPRFVRRSVSGASPKVKPLPSTFVTVRHVPFTLMLSPSATPSNVFSAPTCRFTPPSAASSSFRTCPTSSTIPVNTIFTPKACGNLALRRSISSFEYLWHPIPRPETTNVNIDPTGKQPPSLSTPLCRPSATVPPSPVRLQLLYLQRPRRKLLLRSACCSLSATAVFWASWSQVEDAAGGSMP
mmetsp:Transcript_2523/g.7549  ORF Transcript_2523/g.7549 Transcript_2523/m.7549 type:complete len:241 (-) Transcript_2523:76-798(-)